MSDYPSEAELQEIRDWQWQVIDGFCYMPLTFFERLKELWWMPEWGWDEYPGVDDHGAPLRIFHISTGGWSGNEELIQAFSENSNLLWQMCWYSHRRGGHYEFRVKLPKDAPNG